MRGRSPESLERLAARFDELYTQMTGVQRRLIAATRGDEDVDEDLFNEALTLLTAAESASWAMSIGQPSRADADAAALAARVLRPPIDGTLLRAALAAQGRAHGFRLLGGALRLAQEHEQLQHTFGAGTAVELLAVPRSMSAATARRFAEAIGVPPDATIADLPADGLERLVAGLEDAVNGGLPEGVETWRRSSPKAPAHGRGAAAHVLDGWVDASGTAADPVYQAARAASRRGGWPEDAADAAAVLVRFTAHQLMPSIVDTWEQLAAIEDPDIQLRAMRAERSRYRDLDDDDSFAVSWLLEYFIDAVVAARKARRLEDGPETDWGSATPLGCARTAARRCGDILSALPADEVLAAVEALPDALPAEARPTP